MHKKNNNKIRKERTFGFPNDLNGILNYDFPKGGIRRNCDVIYFSKKTFSSADFSEPTCPESLSVLILIYRPNEKSFLQVTNVLWETS